MAKALDDLAEFEEFKEKVLGMIRKDIYGGMTPEELRKKYASYVQGRVLTAVITEEDNGKALAAAKDILDRSEGKAKERHEHTHKYENLKEEELDSLLMSELGAMSSSDDDETRSDH